MIHIAFVVPHPSLVPVVEKAWQIHEQVFGSKQNGFEFRYTIDCETSPTTIATRRYDADVIVSRGGTATGLKEQNQLTPIVEIPITSHDLNDSIMAAIEKFGAAQVGVVGTPNMIYPVDHLKLTAPVTIRAYDTKNIKVTSLIDGVSRAVADGARIIVGGQYTCDYSREHGIAAGLIHSSTESVFQAITEAKRCALVFYAERDNSTLFRAIVDHVFEGIIAVDREYRIRTFNPAASEMLGRKAKDCIGHPVDQTLPEGRLNDILHSNEQYTNEIVKINGVNYVLNSVPMLQSERRIGTLVTFQAARAITDAENRIRDRLYVRGHLAKYHFEDILGDSEAIWEAIRQAKKYAHVDSNVLLYGETGTGKELFAQSIHNESERATGPFVAVNCAAIPENLMESELFGYESGAFTGANKAGKAGLFEVAHGGTIFLDEVSEIPLILQNRLLRVIQEREVRRIGADRVIPIDVRIICATNRNLADMIEHGKFREDLYYRLKVLSIELPPLRERKGDILLIMRSFISYYSHKFGKDEIRLSQAAMETAQDYSWPGNLRELRNVSEQLAVLCENNLVSLEDMYTALPVHAAKTDSVREKEKNVQSRLRDMERKQIMDVLSRARNRKEAAQILGIGKTTLWRKCKEYGL